MAGLNPTPVGAIDRVRYQNAKKIVKKKDCDSTKIEFTLRKTFTGLITFEVESYMFSSSSSSNIRPTTYPEAIFSSLPLNLLESQILFLFILDKANGIHFAATERQVLLQMIVLEQSL